MHLTPGKQTLQGVIPEYFISMGMMWLQNKLFYVFAIFTGKSRSGYVRWGEKTSAAISYIHAYIQLRNMFIQTYALKIGCITKV